MKNIVSELYSRVENNVAKVIVGKSEITKKAFITLLCNGHMLIEDVPGTGKTTFVKAFAKSLDCVFRRVQFTPDLMPSDITGINAFNVKTSEFIFMPGPVFTNILLADEINRATPKTQAGLLECMEERQVTVDGVTRKLAVPFMVIATQNSVESSGVFPLPEAQLDRFLFKTSMSHPTVEEETDILARFDKESPLDTLGAVATKDALDEAVKYVNSVYIHRDLLEYIAKLVDATRNLEAVQCGISTRGSVALMRAAKASAAIEGRNYVIPSDIKTYVPEVFTHRLILKSGARFKTGLAEKNVASVLASVPVPTESASAWNL